MVVMARRIVLTLILICFTGCQDLPPQQITNSSAPSELARDFNPAATGTLVGRVIWEGPIPRVPAFEVKNYPDNQAELPPPGSWPNLHAPVVDSETQGVQNAVIFWRQVDLRKSRPWNHEPVQVEMGRWQMQVKQGSTASPVGFVQRGENITAVTKKKIFHVLRGQGAAFFSLPFPDPEFTTTKRLDQVGRVELFSGAAYYWMVAHLFVNEHPYYTLSDTQGRFEMAQVPEGTYQVICWLPNWNIAWQVRDPESSQITRIGYAPPVELEANVNVASGKRGQVDFKVATKLFPSK
jgi:hypothetical protein